MSSDSSAHRTLAYQAAILITSAVGLIVLWLVFQATIPDPPGHFVPYAAGAWSMMFTLTILNTISLKATGRPAIELGAGGEP